MHEGTLEPRQGDAADDEHAASPARRIPCTGYDVIGNVRGSAERLLKMLRRLGYEPTPDLTWHHPGGRTAVFTGGIATPHGNTTPCTALVRSMVDAGTALCVLGAGEFDAIAATHAPRRVLVPANAPTANIAGGVVEPFSSKSFSSSVMAPPIAGMASKKEKVAAA